MASSIHNLDLVIVSYPQYTGGKFIMNCLSLSEHALPLCRSSSNYLFNNPKDYSYRLQYCLDTLTENTTDWLNYESHTSRFYGLQGGFDIAVKQLLRLDLNSETMLFLNNVSDIGYTVFSETPFYEFGNISKFLQIFPKTRIIQLKNFQSFFEVAYKIKTGTVSGEPKQHFGNYCEKAYNELKGTHWPTWQQFEDKNYHALSTDMTEFYHDYPVVDTYNIDVDKTYFDKDAFLTMMQDLYKWIGYNDFQSQLVEQYYDKYMALHSLTKDKI